MKRPLLGVLDVGRPSHMPDLVAELEELGYHRYWTTEHHSPRQSASPTILAALAAGLTDSIRVGTAGVLLNYRSALAVATDFQLLSQFFGDRIDLGIVGSQVREPTKAALLDGRASGKSGFEQKAKELVSMVRTRTLDGRPIGPAIDTKTLTEIWICGTGKSSALLAAKLGVSFAYHHYLAENFSKATDGPELVRAYVENFKPTAAQPTPKTLVACFGVCQPRQADAEEAWRNAFLGDSSIPKPTFLGDPEQCAAELLDIYNRYQIDELVVHTPVENLALRISSYTLLASALGLSAGRTSDAPRVGPVTVDRSA